MLLIASLKYLLWTFQESPGFRRGEYQGDPSLTGRELADIVCVTEMVIEFDHNLGMTGKASTKVKLRIFAKLCNLKVDVFSKTY